MELLVYVRNHGGRPAGSTFVGASIGATPSAEVVDPPLERITPVTSMAEFRIDAAVADPLRELSAAVYDLFGRLGPQTHGRTIYLARDQSALKVMLEPGFDTKLDIGCDLGQMLAMCRQAHAPRPAVPA